MQLCVLYTFTIQVMYKSKLYCQFIKILHITHKKLVFIKKNRFK